jgi:hypothetical protein
MIINEGVGASFTGSGLFTAAPYRVLEPEHWIFAGTNLDDGDLSHDVPLHLRRRLDLQLRVWRLHRNA